MIVRGSLSRGCWVTLCDVEIGFLRNMHMPVHPRLVCTPVLLKGRNSARALGSLREYSCDALGAENEA